MVDKEVLISKIIDCANNVRRILTSGYLEKVYENALAHELSQIGISVSQQQPLEVRYKGTVVGHYIADLIVEGIVIVEIKSIKNIDLSHETQLVNYLTSTGIDDGLIINFGNPVKIQIKRKYRTYKPS